MEMEADQAVAAETIIALGKPTDNTPGQPQLPAEQEGQKKKKKKKKKKQKQKK